MSLIPPKEALRIAPRHALFGAAVVFLLACGCQKTDPGAGELTNSSSSEPQWVTLTIKHDTTLEFEPIEWYEKMTVFDVLSEAHSRDSVDFQYQGKGGRTLVTAIDGVAGGDGGWIYSVNGERGVRSCGISQVKPDDSILWEYSEY